MLSIILADKQELVVILVLVVTIRDVNGIASIAIGSIDSSISIDITVGIVIHSVVSQLSVVAQFEGGIISLGQTLDRVLETVWLKFSLPLIT